LFWLEIAGGFKALDVQMLQLFRQLLWSLGILVLIVASAFAQRPGGDDDDDDGGGRRRRGGFGESGGFEEGGSGFGGSGGRRGFGRGGFDEGGGFGGGGFGGRGGFERGMIEDRFGGRSPFEERGFGGRSRFEDRGFGERSEFDRGSFEDRGFGGRGGFSRGGFGRSSGDPTEFLRQLDLNGNGVLEPTEMQGRARFMVDRVAREAGLDTSQPISLVRLQESLQQIRERRLGGPGTTPGGLSASGSSTTRTDTKPAALVPGFGPEFETVVVPGFGEPLAVATSGSLNSTASAAATATVSEADRRSRGENPRERDRDDDERGGRGRGRGGDRGFESRRGDGDRSEDNNRRSEPVAASVSSPTTTSSTSAPGSAGGNDRIRRIAQAMLSRYDENKDGILQKEEWSKMSNEPEKGDKNGDGQITLDEMSERLGEWRPGSSSSSSSAPASSAATAQVSPGTASTGGREGFGGGGGFRGRGGRGGFGGREGPSAPRPTATASGQAHRFLTPRERLPEDLPSFFTSDRDGDGQVSMAEFTSSWDDAKLAEFNRWDLNRDGMITPAEGQRASAR
jgi:hypothetical protein